MTIIIKTIKRRPSGEISARETRFETDTIILGRADNCDVVLPDLRLALEHAEISAAQRGGISLRVLGSGKVLINGKSVTTASSLPVGTIIKMGGYHLCVLAPDDVSDIVISVEMLDPLRPTITAQDTGRVFNLRHALPGKRLMAWCFSLCIFGLFLALPIWVFNQKANDRPLSLPFKTDTAWNSGALSLMHANLENDCSVCHTKAFTSVKDNACTSCHEDLNTHAKPEDLQKTTPEHHGFTAGLQSISKAFGRPIDRCASCHVEHNPRVDLISNEQKLCTSCHENLDHSLPQTTLKNVSDFETDHPQFKPAIITKPDHINPVTMRVSLDEEPLGRSGLKFSHALHMGDKNAVAKQAFDVGGKFGNGVSCSDCHRPESGGALFDPVNMKQDCAVCHSLGFEDAGEIRTLRHGEPKEVIATMRDFYQAKALANIRDVEMNSSTRRRPGRAASLRDLNRRELAFAQADGRTAAKVSAIFSEGGACFECHDVVRPDLGRVKLEPSEQDSPPTLSLDFDISPVSINDAFYAASSFNHQSHEISDLTCASCHAAKKSKLSDDVLLPKIEVCRDCHVSPQNNRLDNTLKQGRFPTTCLTCHAYHDGAHGVKMGADASK